MKTKSLFALIACIGLVGCEQAPSTDKVAITPTVSPSTNQVEKVERFVIKSVGYASIGPVADKRAEEIFIVTDTVTGDEILGISGAGLTHIRKAKQQEAAADAMSDIIGDLSNAFTD